MVPYYGDFAEDDTVNIPFNTFTSDDPSASVTITNLADADIKVHKDGHIDEIATDGATVVINFDGVTGNHLITIDTNVDAAYAIGSEYQVRIEGTTVDGATINAWVGSFSIERAGGVLAMLKSATYGLSVLEGFVDCLPGSLNNLAQSDILSDATPIHGGNVNTLSGHDPGATICADGTPLTSGETESAVDAAFENAIPATPDGDSINDYIQRLKWSLVNKIAITEADGNTITYKDDDTTAAATVAAAFDSDGTTTIRKRLE